MSTTDTPPVKVVKGVKHVQLECSQGHTWWRVSQRGRRPTVCPDHSEAAHASESRPKVTPDASTPPASYTVSDEDLALYEKMDHSERERILGADRRLTLAIRYGNREEKDVDLLMAVRKDCLTRIKRRLSNAYGF